MPLIEDLLLQNGVFHLPVDSFVHDDPFIRDRHISEVRSNLRRSKGGLVSNLEERLVLLRLIDGYLQLKQLFSNTKKIRSDDALSLLKICVVNTPKDIQIQISTAVAQECEKTKQVNPVRTRLKHSIKTAPGSNVLALDSLLEIRSLATLGTRLGGKPLGAKQAVSASETIDNCIWGGAYLTRTETMQGALEANRLANTDMTVLSENTTETPPESIPDAEVEATFVKDNTPTTANP